MKWKKDEAKTRPRSGSPSDTEESIAPVASPTSSSEAADSAQHSTAISCKTTKDMNANDEKNSGGGDISDCLNAESPCLTEKRKTKAIMSLDIIDDTSLKKSHSLNSSKGSEVGTASPTSLSNISP